MKSLEEDHDVCAGRLFLFSKNDGVHEVFFIQFSQTPTSRIYLRLQ